MTATQILKALPKRGHSSKQGRPKDLRSVSVPTGGVGREGVAMAQGSQMDCPGFYLAV